MEYKYFACHVGYGGHDGWPDTATTHTASPTTPFTDTTSPMRAGEHSRRGSWAANGSELSFSSVPGAGLAPGVFMNNSFISGGVLHLGILLIRSPSCSRLLNVQNNSSNPVKVQCCWSACSVNSKALRYSMFAFHYCLVLAFDCKY